MDLNLSMLKIWGLKIKGLQSYWPSNFENDLTQGELKSGLIGSSGAGGRLFWDLQLWQLVTLKPFDLQILYV